MTYDDIYRLVQGERRQKFSKEIKVEKEKNAKIEKKKKKKKKKIPFFERDVLTNRLTLICLFSLSVEDLVANR